MNSIENTRGTTHNSALLPPIPSPTNSAPVNENHTAGEETNASLFCKLLAGFLPLLGLLMSAVTYYLDDNPNPAKQIFEASLCGLAAQILLLVGLIMLLSSLHIYFPC